jgi:Subtilase family/Secretion system C-terminal sorting domain
MTCKHTVFLLAFCCFGAVMFAQSAIAPITAFGKISPLLSEKLQATAAANLSIVLWVADTAFLTQQPKSFKYQILQSTPKGHAVMVPNADTAVIAKLASMTNVQHIEAMRLPKPEANSTRIDYTLNRIHRLRQKWPQINGDGLTLSIKEARFDTNDIDLRGRCLISSYSFDGLDQHATTMATIAGGGGNSDPSTAGVAPAARLSSDSYLSLLPTADAYFASQDITVQNHSYGTGIENYYGMEAMAYDAHCEASPNIVHVFSAGNDGLQSATTGQYANLPGFANLTGQFKQSKNTISVSATDSLGMPLSISSHGPAHDGRIKPELLAFGTGGSSEAAALVSGTSLLMQQAYAQVSGGGLPPASLIKAILTNTAQDTGQPGLDYGSGFGNLDAERCISTIFDGHFLTENLSAGEVREFQIEVPANTDKLKLMLAWNDPAADINAAKALVNDLDLELVHVPSGEVWLPWTLNPFPHPDSLQLPARRGRDSLNNLEQITLDLPAAGTYTLRVKAPANLTGTQAFSLTWQWEPLGQFTWISPIADSKPPTNTGIVLRWEGNLASPIGKLQYRYIGDDWQLINDNVALADGYLRHWTTPDRAGIAQLKMETNEGSFISDSILIALQLRPRVGFDCPDSLHFYWSKMEAASSYQVFELGPRYLELLAETTDTFFIQDAVGKAASLYYAVAPVIDGVVGPRSGSFNYTQQGVGCYLKAFYFHSKEGDKAKFSASVGTLYGLESVVLERLTGGGFAPAQAISPIENTSFGFDDVQLFEGVNYFRLKLGLENGGEVFSELLAVYHVESDDYLLYPNPVSLGSIVNLLSKSDLIAAYEMYDMQGRLVLYNELDDQPTRLDTTGLSAGCYTVRVTYEEGGRWAGRLVIW